MARRRKSWFGKQLRAWGRNPVRTYKRTQNRVSKWQAARAEDANKIIRDRDAAAHRKAQALQERAGYRMAAQGVNPLRPAEALQGPAAGRDKKSGSRQYEIVHPAETPEARIDRERQEKFDWDRRNVRPEDRVKLDALDARWFPNKSLEVGVTRSATVQGQKVPGKYKVSRRAGNPGQMYFNKTPVFCGAPTKKKGHYCEHPYPGNVGRCPAGHTPVKRTRLI